MSLVSDVSASSSTMSSASSSSSTEVEYDNGVHTAAEMQAAWQAAGEAEMKKQAALHDELQRLTDENAKLTGQLEKMANEQIELKAAERVACMAQEIAQKEEAAKSEKLVANLQVRTEKQEEKIKQLSTAKHALEVRLSGQSGEFYNSLNAKVSSQTEEIKKLTDDNTLLKSRNENVEHDLREMQTRLNDVELGRQGLLESHRRLVDDCNNNGIACTQTDAQLEGAKELNVLLRESLDNYRAEVAECVTKLDMCYGDWRIFTCDHNTIHDIPDGVCITHGVYTDRLAKDLCVKFSEDPAFVRVYNAYRKSVLKHHRAHERVDQGRRAMRSWRLKTEFLEVDGERGIVPNY